MRQAIPLTVLFMLIAAVSSSALGDDWPQWRGPNRDGKSAETGLLKSWPKGGPPLAWRVTSAGVGYGAPSIADGKIFVMGNGEEREWVTCLDESNGKQIWSCKTGRVRSKGGGYPGPRCTPTYANGKVYVLGVAGRLVCCDAENGRPLWYKDLPRHFGGEEPRYGYSESVLVDGDRVICTPGMKKTVVALNAETGEEIWAVNAGDPASYSSIIKTVIAETPQYIAFTERGLIGIRASDAALLWRWDAPSNGQANCPTPVVVGSTVFAASGYGNGGGCAWIKKDKEGKFNAQQIYFTNKMQNQHGGFVVVDGFLYGCSDPGVLVCMNYKTGMVVKASYSGRFSIAYADGMLYVRNERGRMDLYGASSKKLTKQGTFEQPLRSKSKTWSHPVIANGRLYLRDQFVLLSYNIKAEEEEKAGPPAKGKAPAAKPAAKGKTPAAKPAAKDKAPAAKIKQLY